MNMDVKIRRADMSDIPKLAHLLSSAFHFDPVSTWLMPDPDDRARRHPAFFRIFLEHAIVWGEVHTTHEFEGVALWLDVDPDTGIQSGGEAAELFRSALGPNYERFKVLDAEMQSTHPTHARHMFLPFIGVIPEEQEQGIGRALMLRKLIALDEVRMPVYLEATSLRSRRFYERLGFKQLPARISLPGGTSMFPLHLLGQYQLGPRPSRLSAYDQ
jgi:ribosomal protein S18 acetylase RimI-like enzyme